MGEDGEPIESIDWLHAFSERYLGGWNSHDPDAVTACATEDVIWIDPALPEPARGHGELADFVRSGCTAFPDLNFSESAPPAITEDRLLAYAPWRMTGTNTGPIEPPGFAPTGKSVDVPGFDIWRFRDGLIWRYEAIYDFSLIARQLGLAPPPGGFAERSMVRLQRLQAKIRR